MYINKGIEEVLKWSTKQSAISNTQELQKDESLIFFFPKHKLFVETVLFCGM